MTRTVLNAYELAGLADCAYPDSLESPGATFLSGVQDAVNDQFANGEANEDSASEIADSAVPIYTYAKWEAFVDLAAWQEDIDDYGTPEDMDQASNWALYVIAERLALALLEQAGEES